MKRHEGPSLPTYPLETADGLMQIGRLIRRRGDGTLVGDLMDRIDVISFKTTGITIKLSESPSGKKRNL